MVWQNRDTRPLLATGAVRAAIILGISHQGLGYITWSSALSSTIAVSSDSVLGRQKRRHQMIAMPCTVMQGTWIAIPASPTTFH